MTSKTATAGTSVETPSGKDEAYENFPVGSWLLPAAARPHVAAFYAFARAIDDIADTPSLPASEKIARLQGFEDAVTGREAREPAFATGHRMRDTLRVTGISPQHCVDLIAAFKQDAVKTRYETWEDLLGYCILSAAPVGRFLLDLHGGSRDGYGPSDALCMALQVINHLQDCQDDYRTLDRVYLPGDWMAREGTEVAALDHSVCSPAMRRVLDRCLDATAELMTEARRLPVGLRSRRLAMESAAIVTIADRLVALLRRRDPLAGRVALTKAGYLWCCGRGIVSVFL